MEEWVAALMLHANLKPPGLESKFFSPYMVKPGSRKVVISGSLKFLKATQDDFDSSRNDTPKIFTKFWVEGFATLYEDGTLEISSSPSSPTISTVQVGSLSSSGIRCLDRSIFDTPNVIYLGKSLQNDDSFTSKVFSKLNRSTHVGNMPQSSSTYFHSNSSFSSPDFRVSTPTKSNSQIVNKRKSLQSFKQSSPHITEIEAKPIITLDENCFILNPHREDSDSFYIHFVSSSDCNRWFAALKSLARLEVFSPSTGDLSQSFRISRTINIRIFEAKLDVSDFSLLTLDQQKKLQYPDTYVEIFIGNQICGRSTVAFSSRVPFWREDFTFKDLPGVSFPIFYLVLRKKAVKGDLTPQMAVNCNQIDPVLGIVALSPEDIKKNGNVEKWYEIMPVFQPGCKNNFIDDLQFDWTQSKIRASLCLKIAYEELTVGPSDCYKIIGRTLNALANNNWARLVQTDERRDVTNISETCLKISLSEPTGTAAINWLKSLITEEISKTHKLMVEKSGDPNLFENSNTSFSDLKRNIDNTLFRGNSILTKSLERYMRIVGLDLLQDTVGKFVIMVLEAKPDLEMDPSRIKLQLPKNAINASIDEIVKEHQQQLYEYASKMWHLIRDTAESIPYGFKEIFHHLAEELRTVLNQPQSSIYNSIAGFLFLRFFCPGILNPKLFGLIKSQRINTSQRSLTLITKMIQCLANRTRFGIKEPWMIPMNSFFDVHEDELIEYFGKVINIDNISSSMINKHPIYFDYSPHQLAEYLNNPYVIDRTATFSRLIELWKTSYCTAEQLHKLTIQRNQTCKPGKKLIFEDLDKFEKEVIPTLENQPLEDLIIDFSKLCNYVDDVVRSIRAKLEVQQEAFNPENCEEYSRHIQLLSSPSKRQLFLGRMILSKNDFSTDLESVSRVESESITLFSTTKPSSSPNLKEVELNKTDVDDSLDHDDALDYYYSESHEFDVSSPDYTHLKEGISSSDSQKSFSLSPNIDLIKRPLSTQTFTSNQKHSQLASPTPVNKSKSKNRPRSFTFSPTTTSYSAVAAACTASKTNPIHLVPPTILSSSLNENQSKSQSRAYTSLSNASMTSPSSSSVKTKDSRIRSKSQPRSGNLEDSKSSNKIPSRPSTPTVTSYSSFKIPQYFNHHPTHSSTKSLGHNRINRQHNRSRSSGYHSSIDGRTHLPGSVYLSNKSTYNSSRSVSNNYVTILPVYKSLPTDSSQNHSKINSQPTSSTPTSLSFTSPVAAAAAAAAIAASNERKSPKI